MGNAGNFVLVHNAEEDKSYKGKSSQLFSQRLDTVSQSTNCSTFVSASGSRHPAEQITFYWKEKSCPFAATIQF